MTTALFFRGNKSPVNPFNTPFRISSQSLFQPDGKTARMSEDLLWKQCADWLCRLQVLPTNHRIVSPDSSVLELAYTLRDGVVLCYVLSSLNPDSIHMKNVNQRPQMAQFLCLKNIRTFLNSCSEFFQLKETDLFQPSMLYDYTDFVRVLHTLSKLSNCPKVKASRPDLQGFPGYSAAPVQDVVVGHDEEEIYKTLEQVTNEDKYQEFYEQHHGGSTYGYGRSTGGRSSNGTYGKTEGFYATVDQEEIYEDLCSFKQDQDQTAGRSFETSTSTASSLPRAAPHLSKPKEKRDYCVKELVETEANYVDVLSMLRKHFLRPITTLKDSDKKVVFANIRELGDIHASFYNDLLESIKPSTSKSLGHVFLDFKLKFLIYGDFCADLTVAQQTLDALSAKDPAVAEEIAQCEVEANGGRFRLRDLLAVPMQRVLKYHLLLKQLMTHTPMDHNDFAAIQQAYEAMVDVSEYINESKRDSELLNIIREIQHSITDWNLPAGTDLRDYGGRLRRDGELKVSSHEPNAKTKVRYVFVFDQVMIMCKPSKGDHYAYKDSLKIADYNVQDVPVMTPTVGTTGRKSRESMRWAHSFILVHVQKKNAFTLYTRTQEDKAKWMLEIGKAIANVSPPERLSTNHHVIMASFEKGAACHNCDKLFKGLFYQGYECTICSCKVHGGDCLASVPKCGSLQPKIPPDLPPRPLSMLVTTSAQDEGFLLRQNSTRSLIVTSNTHASTLDPKSRSSSHLQKQNSEPLPPEYVNTQMEDHGWYVHDMDRQTANAKLMDYPVNTFLVRSRVQGGVRVGQAVSLRMERDVKHMKICVEKHEDGSVWYYLSENHRFRSVVELVNWYQRNSLKESFSGLDTTLRFSVGDLMLVRAKYEFSPALSDKNMLSLVPDEKLVVIDKVTGHSQGWWKACKNNRIGYIPKDFVELIQDFQNELTL